MDQFTPFLALRDPLDLAQKGVQAFFWLSIGGLVLAIHLRNQRRAKQAKTAPPPPLATAPAGDGQGLPLRTAGLESHEIAAMRRRLLFPSYVMVGVCLGLGLLWLVMSPGFKNGSEMRWTALGVNAFGGGMLAIALVRTKRLARDALRAECLVSDVGRLGSRTAGQARFPATFTFNFQGRRQVIRHQSVPEWFLRQAAQHQGKATIIVDGLNLSNILSFHGEDGAESESKPGTYSHRYVQRK